MLFLRYFALCFMTAFVFDRSSFPRSGSNSRRKGIKELLRRHTCRFRRVSFQV